MAASSQPGIRWVEQTPEPARFWIRWRPRGWPPPPWDWTDLATGALGDPGPAPGGLAPPPVSGDDVVWLPPGPPALEPERLRFAEDLARAGSPVLVQVAVTGAGAAGPAPSQGLAAVARAGAVVVLDPLPALLGPGLGDALEAVAGAMPGLSGAAAVWPLIAGLNDAEDDAARAAEALAAAGLAAVQPLALRLTPAQRRRLSEAGGGAFDALFHRPAPAERPLARALTAAGLAPFLPRPLPRPPLRGAESRRLAGLLALAGELWLRCGRAPEAGHALLRAARWADAAGYDLGALAREGNLGVVTALDDRSRELLAEAAAGGEPRLVRELLAEYAGAAAGPEPTGARRAAAEEVWDG